MAVPSSSEQDAAMLLVRQLDRYETELRSVQQGSLGPSEYERLASSLDAIRKLNEVLFSQISAVAGDFIVTHATLMTTLFNEQLRGMQGAVASGSQGARDAWAAHFAAITQLRQACVQLTPDRTGGAAGLH